MSRALRYRARRRKRPVTRPQRMWQPPKALSSGGCRRLAGTVAARRTAEACAVARTARVWWRRHPSCGFGFGAAMGACPACMGGRSACLSVLGLHRCMLALFLAYCSCTLRQRAEHNSSGGGCLLAGALSPGGAGRGSLWDAASMRAVVSALSEACDAGAQRLGSCATDFLGSSRWQL